MLHLDFSDFDLVLARSSSDSDAYFKAVLEFIENVIVLNPIQIQSSGSTGAPKQFTFSYEQATASAQTSNDFFKVTKDSHFLLCLDIRFVASKMMIYRAFVAGAKLTVVKPSLHFYEDIGDQKFQFLSLTPIHLHHILENKPQVLCQFKTILLGGARITSNLNTKIEELNTTARFFESFGMSETLSHFAVRNISEHEIGFRMLSGFQFHTNSDNQLIIAHSTILPNPIVSNDIVEQINENRFRFVGRRDFIINSSGIKINPEVEEDQLLPFFRQPFILASEPNDKLGEQLILILKSSEGQTKNEIMKILKSSTIDRILIPKEIYLCPSWPLTDSLKPKRREIFENRIDF
jgi:O-succinylbenzoic acid--CoA ligase